MRLSFPLAVLLALLANLIPVWNRVDTNRQDTSNTSKSGSGTD
jgi:hypothetical protein